MSNSAKADAMLALNRFGMGPRPGSIAAIESDPRGALLAELDRPMTSLAAASALPSSAQALRTVADFNARQLARAAVAKREKDAKQRHMAEASAMAAPAMMETAATADKDAKADKEMAAKSEAENPRQPIYLAEAKIRTEAALNADIGLSERLVWFWSNHFCISADSIRSMVGAYEREAIRPHVLGRFTDLLLAVEGHPAMLVYLDNLVSMGTNSTTGMIRNRGLNENFARETLELHTLGVQSGYTQDDVISFAKVMTGWTWLPPADDPEHGGEFAFNPRLHEPGAKTVLGKVYEDEGIDQGRAVLRDLAVHPATAAHVATKLARHFIADTPPPALVETMTKVFIETGGDLKEVCKAMLSSPDSWSAPATKLKRPGEWIVGMVRATGIAQVDPKRYTDAETLLGEALWRPS
ncbi:DUF1800 domain-containing protein, partial [Bradyrhizobium sp.]|uniref:DUF1800 domain-containing protein n=1 Tax=Bradyrhizobium sp. TaxID=376 RepID=UPI003C6528B0